MEIFTLLYCNNFLQNIFQEVSGKEAKKRGRAPDEKKKDVKKNDDSEAPAKRGRGRPKGSIKKNKSKSKVFAITLKKNSV